MIPTSKKMNTRTSYVVIAIMAVVGGLSIMPAFGQQLPTLERIQVDDREYANQATMNRTPITIWTDKTIYDHGSKIIVEGFIPNARPNSEVGLKVVGPPPFNNVVTIAQLKVNSDGSFQTTLSTSGQPWKYDGTYTIRATYGTQEVFDTTLVQLTGGVGLGFDTTKCQPSELPAGGKCIPYTITGGVVTGAQANPQDKSLVFSISAVEDGTFTINPTTDVIKGIFMVLVDGEEWDDVSINGNSVSVMFPAGTETIEVIGTFVIPEFGTIAALILAVAIISIIAISAKTRLNVLPKY